MYPRISIATAAGAGLVGLALLWAAPARAADKPTVVATFSVLADMVANVAGDQSTLQQSSALAATRSYISRRLPTADPLRRRKSFS